MNLPISWVAAAALPASRAVQATANLASKSASHIFGNLMQPDPPVADNGRSVSTNSSSRLNPHSSDTKESWNDRFDSLRDLLGKVVADARKKFSLPAGSSSVSGLNILSDGKSPPTVHGPEPVRTALEQHLSLHPNVANEISKLAATKSSAEPLRLLPNRQSLQQADGPLRIWLD